MSTSISDHEMTTCIRKINNAKHNPKTIKCRDYTNYDPEQLNKSFENVNWNAVYQSDDINTCLRHFNETVQNVFDQHAPQLEKRVKGRKCPWITIELKRKMNNRDRVLRKARKSNCEADWDLYKRLRNSCNKQLRKEKATYHQRLLQESSPKNFWNTIKKIFPTKPITKQITHNVKSRVQVFSHYFSTAIRVLKSINLPLTDFIWRAPNQIFDRTHKRFEFTYVSKLFIEKELKKLKRKKATGIDQLPSGMLKDCAKHISQPLCYIINLSLKMQTIPTLWKIAKITPLFKSGNPDLPENYRPISVLPVLSKVLERAVHCQLSTYLEENFLLSTSQYGFRKHRSTKLAATLLCDSLRQEMDDGKMIGVAYIDLSKAFDTIGHGLLLEKLASYGVKDQELSWFNDYLFNRTQIVEINCVKSNPESIYCGVPQGSILGPLLFVIFFNDFKDHMRNSQVLQYADDTVIWYSSSDAHEIENVLNAEMKRIGTYCKENELLLNLKKGKTEIMLFGTAKRLNNSVKELKIIYNNKTINFVKQYTYLGNVLDNHLNLGENFDKSYKRASGRLKLLTNIRQYLTIDAAFQIYTMMIMPILTYSGAIKLTFTNTQKQKYRRFESRAQKVIGRVVPAITNVVQKDNCMLVKKCIGGSLNNVAFKDYFRLSNSKTRNNSNLIMLPKVKLEVAKGGFFFEGAKIFNALPLFIYLFICSAEVNFGNDCLSFIDFGNVFQANEARKSK